MTYEIIVDHDGVNIYNDGDELVLIVDTEGLQGEGVTPALRRFVEHANIGQAVSEVGKALGCEFAAQTEKSG